MFHQQEGDSTGGGANESPFTKEELDSDEGLDVSSIAKEIGQDGNSSSTVALETALEGLPPRFLMLHSLNFCFGSSKISL